MRELENGGFVVAHSFIPSFLFFFFLDENLICCKCQKVDLFFWLGHLIYSEAWVLWHLLPDASQTAIVHTKGGVS